jgi:DNA polymerase/3'-5' exonuclease PolX
MRSLASKMHMSLSEHGLCQNIVRSGTEKMNAGDKLFTPNEQAVFVHLNLTYRLPEERDFS